MKLKLLFYFFSFLISIGLSAHTQVSVFNYPGLNGWDSSGGCDNENANLISIINANPELSVHTSIFRFIYPSLLASQSDASTFFFMTDMETQSPTNPSFLPLASREVIRQWVEGGWVMVMTGTNGANDPILLNL